MQFLPILMVLFVLFLYSAGYVFPSLPFTMKLIWTRLVNLISIFRSNEPNFSLTKTGSFIVRKSTNNWDTEYYVKPHTERGIGEGSIDREALEREVERQWKVETQQKCSVEKQQKYRMERAAYLKTNKQK